MREMKNEIAFKGEKEDERGTVSVIDSMRRRL